MKWDLDMKMVPEDPRPDRITDIIIMLTREDGSFYTFLAKSGTMIMETPDLPCHFGDPIPEPKTLDLVLDLPLQMTSISRPIGRK